MPTPRSRKTDKLRIPRPPIPPNALPLEHALHIHAPRLVEAHGAPEPAALHDGHDLRLCGVVEAGAAVARDEVAGEVEGGGGEAGFGVAEEGGDGGVVGVGEDGEPVGAG